MITKTIKEFPRYTVDTNGNIFSKTSNKYLKSIQGDYYRVCLFKNKKRYIKSVHRIVLESFVGIDKTRKLVNHKNGIKNDNRIENLEWCTAKENIRHSITNGFTKIGEKHYKAKLTDVEVREIRNAGCNSSLSKNKQISQHKLAKKYNISRSVIGGIVRGEIWKHIK